MKKVRNWLMVVGVFLLLDWLWLGVIGQGLYESGLGFAWGEFRLLAGVMAQVVIATTLFLVADKISQVDKKTTLLYSTLVGLGIYATYDLTNLYLFAQWPVGLSVIDMLWGSFQGLMAGLVVRVVNK